MDGSCAAQFFLQHYDSMDKAFSCAANCTHSAPSAHSVSSLFKQEPNDNPRITVDPNVNVRVEPRTDVTSEATITIAPHVFTMVNINVNYDSPGGRQ